MKKEVDREGPPLFYTGASGISLASRTTPRNAEISRNYSLSAQGCRHAYDLSGKKGNPIKIPKNIFTKKPPNTRELFNSTF